MNIIDPRYFPWTFNSPYEIYAAGRWFGSRENPAWQDRARRWAIRNSPVYRGEFPESEYAVLSLVKELFFLHLTVRHESPEILKALELLKSFEDSQAHRSRTSTDIPFEPAEDPDFVIHAWLFCAAVFGESDSPAWQESAERRGRRILTEDKSLHSGSLYNFLRGTLIVAGAEDIPGVTEAVGYLAARQEDSGCRSVPAPWQLYNLMAHSTLQEALRILEKLEPTLLARQNRDGSWGTGEQKALATFLMAHGLQNRDLLTAID